MKKTIQLLLLTVTIAISSTVVAQQNVNFNIDKKYNNAELIVTDGDQSYTQTITDEKAMDWLRKFDDINVSSTDGNTSVTVVKEGKTKTYNFDITISKWKALLNLEYINLLEDLDLERIKGDWSNAAAIIDEFEDKATIEKETVSENTVIYNIVMPK